MYKEPRGRYQAGQYEFQIILLFNSKWLIAQPLAGVNLLALRAAHRLRPARKLH
jgi:hypothetical protein